MTTEELYAEVAEWLRSRPPQVQQLVLRFPINCVVELADAEDDPILHPPCRAAVRSYYDCGTMLGISIGGFGRLPLCAKHAKVVELDPRFTHEKMAELIGS